MRRDWSWIHSALRRFHCALRSGGTVSVASSVRFCAISPALRALALSGLGGLTLVACAPVDGGIASIASVPATSGLDAPAPGRTAIVEFLSSVGSGTERAAACVALADLALAKGASLGDRAARIAGVTRRAPGGELEWDAGRLSPRMNDQAFSRIAALHERGHCEDATMPAPSAIVALPAEDREWALHRWEVFADSWATLAALRDGIQRDAVEEWADLRAVGVLMNGVRRNGGDAWARYHTAPAIDAAIAWAETSGTVAVRGLSDDQIARVARNVAERHQLDRASHAALLRQVPRIRIEDGKAMLGPELPVGFGARTELALARTGVAPRPSDRIPPARY